MRNDASHPCEWLIEENTLEKWDLTQEVKDGQAIPRGERTLGGGGGG